METAEVQKESQQCWHYVTIKFLDCYKILLSTGRKLAETFKLPCVQLKHFTRPIKYQYSRRSSVSTVTGLTTNIRFPIGTGKENFVFSTASRPLLGPTQPPIQGVQGVFTPSLKWPVVKLTTHLHLALRFQVYVEL
jgi:hypothetical protein